MYFFQFEIFSMQNQKRKKKKRSISKKKKTSTTTSKFIAMSLICPSATKIYVYSSALTPTSRFLLADYSAVPPQVAVYGKVNKGGYDVTFGFFKDRAVNTEDCDTVNYCNATFKKQSPPLEYAKDLERQYLLTSLAQNEKFKSRAESARIVQFVEGLIQSCAAPTNSSKRGSDASNSQNHRTGQEPSEWTDQVGVLTSVSSSSSSIQSHQAACAPTALIIPCNTKDTSSSRDKPKDPSTNTDSLPSSRNPSDDTETPQAPPTDGSDAGQLYKFISGDTTMTSTSEADIISMTKDPKFEEKALALIRSCRKIDEMIIPRSIDNDSTNRDVIESMQKWLSVLFILRGHSAMLRSNKNQCEIYIVYQIHSLIETHLAAKHPCALEPFDQDMLYSVADKAQRLNLPAVTERVTSFLQSLQQTTQSSSSDITDAAVDLIKDCTSKVVEAYAEDTQMTEHEFEEEPIGSVILNMISSHKFVDLHERTTSLVAAIGTEEDRSKVEDAFTTLVSSLPIGIFVRRFVAGNEERQLNEQLMARTEALFVCLSEGLQEFASMLSASSVSQIEGNDDQTGLICSLFKKYAHVQRTPTLTHSFC